MFAFLFPCLGIQQGKGLLDYLARDKNTLEAFKVQYDIWNSEALFSSSHLLLSSHQSAVEWLFHSRDHRAYISVLSMAWHMVLKIIMPYHGLCHAQFLFPFFSDAEFMDLN